MNQKCLLKQSTSSYKMIIDTEFERKVHYVCSKIKDLEWSGVLYYTHTGSFEKNDLTIYPKDFILLNIGSAGYTEFSTNPDVVSYMVENNLEDCDLGIIHSHNKMKAFFSNTDLDTLTEEGSERNIFVSLIVNNAGEYVAAITRHIIAEVQKNIKYRSFEDKIKQQNISYKKDYVEYSFLKIQYNTSHNSQYRYIDDIINELQNNIKENKLKEHQYEQQLFNFNE